MTDPMMLQRRDAIKALLAISASGALAACGGTSDGQTRFKAAVEASTLTKVDMALLSSLAQTIIPKTDTAGAIEAGVPETLKMLFSDWGDDNHRAYWKAGLKGLQAHFNTVGGADFAKLSSDKQLELLNVYDAKAFQNGPDEQFYRDMKSTIATAYYMSEPGASEELAYEAVPGDWKGCVPLSDQPRTWAT